MGDGALKTWRSPSSDTEGGSDSKRYKAIGNGMEQPCADFAIEKLVEALKERG